jgi:lipid-binding SYLF domain-containing protein
MGVIAEAPADDTDETEPVVGDKADKTAKGKSKKVKVIRKIPPKVIQEAKGLVIFTAFRSGIAPLGGAGGAGVVIARLEDGCESPRLSTQRELD